MSVSNPPSSEHLSLLCGKKNGMPRRSLDAKGMPGQGDRYLLRRLIVTWQISARSPKLRNASDSLRGRRCPSAGRTKSTVLMTLDAGSRSASDVHALACMTCVTVQGTIWCSRPPGDRPSWKMPVLPVFTDLSTTAGRSEGASSLEPIESDARWPTSVSIRASGHRVSRVRVAGRP
jgi:hypothetical protein